MTTPRLIIDSKMDSKVRVIQMKKNTTTKLTHPFKAVLHGRGRDAVVRARSLLLGERAARFESNMNKKYNNQK